MLSCRRSRKREARGCAGSTVTWGAEDETDPQVHVLLGDFGDGKGRVAGGPGDESEHRQPRRLGASSAPVGAEPDGCGGFASQLSQIADELGVAVDAVA